MDGYLLQNFITLELLNGSAWNLVRKETIVWSLSAIFDSGEVAATSGVNKHSL